MVVNKSVSFTGERFLPEMQDEELEIEHMQRYYCAKKIVTDKVVLDAACGEGYGSRILASVAKKVIGIDIDEVTIKNAKEKYKDKKNLIFIKESIETLASIETDSIDVVVSFETIEHVNQKIQQRFLIEIERVLKKDGILIMSTPDKKEYSERYHFHNQFHLSEFYKEEFIDFLKQKFEYIVLYNQYLEVACFVDKDEINESVIFYNKNKERYNPKGKYIIAVASNEKKILETSFSMVSMYYHEEYLKILDELNYCRKEAITCRARIKDLEPDAERANFLKEECDRRLEELEHRMEEINKMNFQIAELENKVNLKDQELERREKELNARMSEINKRDTQISEQSNSIKLMKEELDRRSIELNCRMEKINQLNLKIAELENKEKLKDEELVRRQGELNHRMKEINKRDEEIASLQNEIKLEKEELERRGLELEFRMKEINKRDIKIAEQSNELKLKNEELERRALELEKRMGIINEFNERVAEQTNEIKLKDEELERRALELEHRMEEINKRDYKIAELIKEFQSKKH